MLMYAYKGRMERMEGTYGYKGRMDIRDVCF